MLTGTTSTGFEYSIPEEQLDNMELLDALAEADSGKLLAISRVCDLLLGREQKARLYDHCRTERGNVPTGAIRDEILDIIQGQDNGKN